MEVVEDEQLQLQREAVEVEVKVVEDEHVQLQRKATAME